MRRGLLVCGVVVVAFVAVVAQAQPRPPTRAASVPASRTPWGHPDLQGIWNVASGTPLERPGKYAGREFLTDEELRQAEKDADERSDAGRRRPRRSQARTQRLLVRQAIDHHDQEDVADYRSSRRKPSGAHTGRRANEGRALK